ncbi:MAG TPA: aminoacetone oxidase family FAD-binding enzyme [Acidobacteriaceae bacterium]
MPRSEHNFDVVVIGAGAAGLMCAIEAGKRGRRAVVLERAEQVGKKILISGGGRCNFTNLHTRPENFLSANPHFAKSALARYRPADFIALVERYEIAYHEKTLGQLFCDGPAQQIVDLLMSECAQAGVRVVTNVEVRAVGRGGAEGPGGGEEFRFEVRTGAGAFRCGSLVIASGGLSIPKMGATGFGYEVARQFGAPIVEARPALVPVVLGGAELARWGDLTGVSAEVVVACGKRRFREKLLFTHRGLSGPAVLQISSYWREGEAVVVDWAPGREIFAPMRGASAGRNAAAARAALRAQAPARLADRLVELLAPTSWTNAALEEMERRIHAWRFAPVGTEGFEKAEVTAGGVSTDALSAQTMECRDVPGLFFIGEVVDVTGQLGGFNFQWAWASGAAAGGNVR